MCKVPRVLSIDDEWKGAIVKMRYIAFIVLPMLFGPSCSGQPIGGRARSAIESGKPNYTITLTPPSGPLSLKSPLLIEMYCTNTTNSDIYMRADICSTCTGEQILLTKDGKEVETTPWQRVTTGRGQPSDWKMFPRSHGNTRVDRYPPGVFWKVNLDLRKFYNITKPGEYKVTAIRTEDTKEGKVVVKSNTVILDIVP
jgi:hypothetical protein